MKLYLFNGTADWDSLHALGIVAESKKEALALYKKVLAPAKRSDYSIKEHEIVNGLIITVFGYDATNIGAYTRDWSDDKST
jgi:hypothetical protein